MSGPLPAFARRLLHPFRTDDSSRTCGESRLARITGFDSLTGLADCHRLQLFLQQHLGNAKPLTLIVLDIDAMQRINDAYGPPAGDLVLQTVATVLQSIARWQDLPARHRPGQMALAMPDTLLATGQRVADTIRRSVAAKIISCGPAQITATASIGIAAASPGDSIVSIDSLLAAAEQAVQAAKLAGQNCVKTCATSIAA
jgi:diguanylate cyclase (GGDEF)-like protein